jgi:DNA adenine methylase
VGGGQAEALALYLAFRSHIVRHLLRAVFFKLQQEVSSGRIDGKEDYVLSDINPKLINTYTAIREDVDAVIRCLDTHPNEEKYYYELRARNFSVGSDVERAAEFIHANKTCFNGLYRENGHGQFNVPYGKRPDAVTYDEENLRAVSASLKGVPVFVHDFAWAVQSAVAGDFAYFDPPYAPVSATSFTQYTADGFTARDQVRLRDCALELKERGVRILISNSSAPFIRNLYSTGFQVHEVDVARAINSNGSGRGAVKELLIT